MHGGSGSGFAASLYDHFFTIRVFNYLFEDHGLSESAFNGVWQSKFHFYLFKLDQILIPTK